MGFDQCFFQCCPHLHDEFINHVNHKDEYYLRNQHDLHTLLLKHQVIQRVEKCTFCCLEQCEYKVIFVIDKEKLENLQMELEHQKEKDQQNMQAMILEMDQLLEKKQGQYMLGNEKIKEISNLLKRQKFLMEENNQEEIMLDMISDLHSLCCRKGNLFYKIS